MTKKHILFLVYRLGDDGVTKALSNTIKGLLELNRFLEVEVLAIVTSSFQDRIHITPQTLYKSEAQLWNDIRRGKFQLEIGECYDIVVAYSCLFCAGVLARSRVKVRKIAWIHTDIKRFLENYSIEYMTRIYSKMDEIICVSEGVKQSVLDVLGEEQRHRLKVIYNPINRKEISELSLIPLEYKDILDKPIVLAVGRLSREKGFVTLIKVHHRLIENKIFHQLIILGDGEQRNELEELIVRLGVQESCLLRGYEYNPYNWISKSQIFVSSSMGEGLPLNIMEAMLLVKPIVATRVMGNEELLMPNLGMLVATQEEALYQGMSQMLLEESCRKQYIEELMRIEKFKFEEEFVLRQLEKLIYND